MAVWLHPESWRCATHDNIKFDPSCTGSSSVAHDRHPPGKNRFIVSASGVLPCLEHQGLRLWLHGCTLIRSREHVLFACRSSHMSGSRRGAHAATASMIKKDAAWRSQPRQPRPAGRPIRRSSAAFGSKMTLLYCAPSRRTYSLAEAVALSYCFDLHLPRGLADASRHRRQGDDLRKPTLDEKHRALKCVACCWSPEIPSVMALPY